MVGLGLVALSTAAMAFWAYSRKSSQLTASDANQAGGKSAMSTAASQNNDASSAESTKDSQEEAAAGIPPTEELDLQGKHSKANLVRLLEAIEVNLKTLYMRTESRLTEAIDQND